MKPILAAGFLLAVNGSAALAQIFFDSTAGINDPVKDLHDPIGALKRVMARTAMLQNGLLADAANEKVRVAGQARIDAGQATTRFQRSPGAFAPAKYGAQAPNPADRQAWTQMYIEGLTFFESLAKQAKINQNDVADGMGLAVAVAYQIYSGGQLATAEQRRIFTEATRQNLLQNAMFQASDDLGKQVVYELHAMNAGVAAAKAGIAAQNRDPALRAEAVRIAHNTLAGLWPYPVEAMELTSAGFDDRGVRLIREGKATDTFTPPPAPLATSPGDLQLWQAFVRYMQNRKIPINNLTGGLGTCIIINWEIAAGGQELSYQQYLWTFQGATKILLTSPDWQRMADVEKERTLELFAIKAMAVSAIMQEALKIREGPTFEFGREVPRNSSLRALKMKAAGSQAVLNLNMMFKPSFASYTLSENGFQLASAPPR